MDTVMMSLQNIPRSETVQKNLIGPAISLLNHREAEVATLREQKKLSTASFVAKLCKEEQQDEVLKARDLIHERHATISLDSIDCLQECTKLPNLAACRRAHISLADIGLDTHAFVADHLIRAFALCRSLSEANSIFCKVVKPSLYTWNAIISAHAKLGDWERSLVMYQQLQQQGLRPDKCTFLAVLKACSGRGTTQERRLIHEQVIISGVASEEVIGITLVDMYVKSGCLEDAYRVFEGLPYQNVVSWNVMISGYAQYGEGHRALELFKKMLPKSVIPDIVTFACMLKVCSNIRAKGHGMLIHGEAIKLGLETDVVVGSALVDMHVKCGSLKCACMLFHKLPNPNVVSWNVILSGYAQSENGLLAFQLFEKMQQQGVKPDKVTFLCILKACGMTMNAHQGKIIHDRIMKCGFESDLAVGNTIIDMYIKLGNLEEGRKVFDKLQNRDVVSWNTLLVGYVEHANAFSAFAFFEELQNEGLKANKFTYACIIKACCDTGSIDLGKSIHVEIIRNRIEVDVVLGNTLIDMYAKCGNLEVAHVVLDDLSAPDVLSWNALIAGYARIGNARMVEWCLKDMQRQGLKPNGGTFTNILVACSHAGQVEVGTRFFCRMQEDCGIVQNIEHFNSMVDLFAHAGCLKEAEALLHTMPLLPDISGWRSLLAACRMYGDTKLGRQCFDKGVQLDPTGSGIYVLIFDIYMNAHMWKDLLEVEEFKKCADAWRIPGKAWIQPSSSKVQEFIVGDKTHVSSDEIYAKLIRFSKLRECEGYVPQLTITEAFDAFLQNNRCNAWDAPTFLQVY